jgi:hypothetical protein
MGTKKLFLLKKIKKLPIPEGAPAESPAVENPQPGELAAQDDKISSTQPQNG